MQKMMDIDFSIDDDSLEAAAAALSSQSSTSENTDLNQFNAVADVAVIDDYIFVDIVGFTNRHNFICKEISIIDGDYYYHGIIKPPYNLCKIPLHDRQMIKWEIDHLHGLRYNDGNIHLLDMVEATHQRLLSKKIVMEDNHKINLLKYIFRNCGTLNCISIEEMDFDLDLYDGDLYPNCGEHARIHYQPACECTSATTLRLKEITKNNLREKKNQPTSWYKLPRLIEKIISLSIGQQQPTSSSSSLSCLQTTIKITKTKLNGPNRPNF